jgi:ABC-type iron transport system FetAB ATPase subunit
VASGTRSDVAGSGRQSWPRGPLLVAVVLTGVSGLCAGLLPAASAAVVRQRRSGTDLALLAVVLAGALFGCLALTIVAAVKERRRAGLGDAWLAERLGRGAPAGTFSVAAGLPAVLAGLIGLAGTGGSYVAIGSVAVVAAALAGSQAPSVESTAAPEGAGTLGAAYGAQTGRLPEPWLVLAARAAAAERTSAGIARVLRRGVVISVIAVIAVTALGLILAQVSSTAPPWHVVLATLAILVVVPAAAVTGAGLRRLTGTSDARHDRERPVVAAAARPHSGAVSLRNVLAGATTTPAGFSTDIAPGEQVGILVPPGSAARSLSAFVLELADPRPGEVVHYGTDGRPLGPPDVLPQVGLITPDITLVAGSIRDNLVFVEPPVDEDRIRHAVDASGLGAVLASCNSGLDAAIETLAEQPSARWRLAAARVLLASPPLAVMYDPFTPATDGSTFAPEVMREVGHGRTLLVITSRPELLDGADYVVRAAA